MYLPNIVKDGAYIKKLEDHKSERTHWITFYINGDDATLELNMSQRN